MHFRVRKNVVQLIRTTYDNADKKAKATVMGTMLLDRPEITDALRAVLTEAEVKEAEAWIEGQYHTATLREELAALTLADTLSAANRWFARQGDSSAASTALASFLPEWHSLRKTLKDKGLLG